MAETVHHQVRGQLDQAMMARAQAHHHVAGQRFVLQVHVMPQQVLQQLAAGLFRVGAVADVMELEGLGRQRVGGMDALHVFTAARVDLEVGAQGLGLQQLAMDGRLQPGQVQVTAQVDDVTQVIIDVTSALADSEAHFLLGGAERAAVYLEHKEFPFL